MLFFRLSQALAVETFFIVIYGLESLILPLLNQKWNPIFGLIIIG